MKKLQKSLAFLEKVMYNTCNTCESDRYTIGICMPAFW